MGSNFHTPWTTATHFRASEMTPPIAALDKACTYNRRPIIGCNGDITYDSSTGQLAWDGTININFVREDGKTILNTIAAGNITVTSGYFAYVTLNETTGSALTVAQAALSAGSASNFLSSNILVLGIRNASSNQFYPVNLPRRVPKSITDPFIASLFYPGTTTDSVVMIYMPIAIPVTFPANFSGSYAKAGTAATGSTAFDVQKNGSSIGTITFAASGAVATFASSGGAAQSFAAGDVLTIVGPATHDATLANIGMALVGTR